VAHVMNITDVGHLDSDADEGEDKLEAGAKRENKSVWDVAEHYIGSFEHDAKLLNILPPNGYSGQHAPYARAIRAMPTSQIRRFILMFLGSMTTASSPARNYLIRKLLHDLK
jgi:hypothetical protein